jgi:hypothetical protein
VSLEADLKVDPKRLVETTTGIYLRARAAGVWCSADLAHLERASVLRWLRSRGGNNLLAENCVLILLGHEPEPSP